MEISIWLALWAVLGLVLIIESVLYFLRPSQDGGGQSMLMRAKQEMQEIVQLPLHNPHPQIQISEQGRIIFANPAALSIFPGIENGGFDHPVLQALDGVESREVSVENKTYHQTVATAYVNGQKSYVIYCYDITDRKWFEQEIKGAYNRAERMRQEAEDAKEARGAFLANMSHELRTPMNGIIGLSDLLVHKNLGEDNQTLIEAVNSSSRNLLILLNDILDFSKIEAGELTLESIPFDLRKIVAQTQFLQQPIAAQKNLALDVDIDSVVPHGLIGDPSRLQQVLNNLINNALKFTETGGVYISVAGQEQADGMFAVVIQVKDTGIGIPDDKQATIFQKFQQADSSTSRKYGGTGLGLSITKDLVELMGGSIAIESTEGEGTIFTISLDLMIDETVHYDVAQSDMAQSVAIDTQARLLIVDDHPVNLLFLRQALFKIGFQEFDEATSGQQALDYCADTHYDLIILDCQMPEVDGYEVARRIRDTQKTDEDIIIVAATADAMKGAIERCQAAGMDDYISKPIDQDKLQNVLQMWLPQTATHACVQDEAPEHVDDAFLSPETEAAVAEDVIVFEDLPDHDQLIDWEHLSEFTEGDPDVEKQVLNVFASTLHTDISALHASLQQKDFQQWDEWVHKIYGASSHIGAKKLAFLCNKGQSLAQNDVQQIHETHKLILMEYKKLNAYLTQRAA